MQHKHKAADGRKTLRLGLGDYVHLNFKLEREIAARNRQNTTA